MAVNYQKQMIALIQEVSGQANVLTIPRMFIDLTGSVGAALFLSQCVYWSSRTTRPDGYFYKSYNEWQSEICLSRREMDRARVDCKAWIKTKLHKANGTPTLYYGVDFTALANSICSKRINGFDRNDQMGLSVSVKPLTETTTEIKTEITTIDPVNYLPLSGESGSEIISDPVSNAWEETSIPEGTPLPEPLAESLPQVPPEALSGESSGNKKTRGDPRTTSPAIRAFRKVTGKYPNKALYGMVIGVLGEAPDLERLREAFTAWVGLGFNPQNLAWLGWYAEGIPDERGGRAQRYDRSVRPGGGEDGEDWQKYRSIETIGSETIQEVDHGRV